MNVRSLSGNNKLYSLGTMSNKEGCMHQCVGTLEVAINVTRRRGGGDILKKILG